MDNEDLIVLGLAGAAVWLILKSKGVIASTAGGTTARFVAPDGVRGNQTHYYTALPWVDPMAYGGPGGLFRDYLETDANGVSIIP